jgi:hypothetical protein
MIGSLKAASSNVLARVVAAVQARAQARAAVVVEAAPMPQSTI